VFSVEAMLFKILLNVKGMSLSSSSTMFARCNASNNEVCFEELRTTLFKIRRERLANEPSLKPRQARVKARQSSSVPFTLMVLYKQTISPSIACGRRRKNYEPHLQLVPIWIEELFDSIGQVWTISRIQQLIKCCLAYLSNVVRYLALRA